MSYAFNANSGATRADLSDMVCANSFSAAKYGEFVKAWLNDAVLAICRRLQIQRGWEVLAYDATGAVTQPQLPFFQVDEVWTASPGAAASGLDAFRTRAQWPIRPLPPHGLSAVAAGSTPVFYVVTRDSSASKRYPQLALTVEPVTVPGFVAVTGLQRPAVMDADTSLTGLGADFDRAVVAWTKSRCFESEDDIQMAQFWDQRYIAALAEAIEGADVDDGPVVVQGTWDD